MTNRIEKNGLRVSAALHDFITRQVLPGTGVDAGQFWNGFSELAHRLAPQNRALLETRDRLQAAIDDWHKGRRGQPHDAAG